MTRTAAMAAAWAARRSASGKAGPHSGSLKKAVVSVFTTASAFDRLVAVRLLESGQAVLDRRRAQLVW